LKVASIWVYKYLSASLLHPSNSASYNKLSQYSHHSSILAALLVAMEFYRRLANGLPMSAEAKQDLADLFQQQSVSTLPRLVLVII
jgi:hypothetical protein